MIVSTPNACGPSRDGLLLKRSAGSARTMINQNFDARAGVVNGSYGLLRRVRRFTDQGGRRYLKSCVVGIPDSIAVDIPHLPEKHFSILPDVTELRFEHGASHKRCTIKRKQVPIEPGFAITVYRAQGKTMERVIVDLASCSGTCYDLEGDVFGWLDGLAWFPGSSKQEEAIRRTTERILSFIASKMENNCALWDGGRSRRRKGPGRGGCGKNEGEGNKTKRGF